MLVCSVVLRPKRGAIAAAIAESATAIDAPSIGAIFAMLSDVPGTASDYLDAFVGKRMVETASAADVIIVNSLRNAIIVEQISAAVAAQNATVSVTPPVTFATLDPATVFETTLSNGNLTATRTAYVVDAYGGAKSSTAYKATGKFYYETTLGVLGGGNMVGLIESTGSYVGSMRDAQKCSAVYMSSGSIFSNNGNSGSSIAAGFVTGDIIATAVDLDGRKAWFRKNGGNWNNSGTANPATGVGGVTVGSGSFAPLAGLGNSSINNVLTLNLGASTFAQAVPSGFTAGWPG